ncbi:unnamed protein product [Rhizopus stolonifer]
MWILGLFIFFIPFSYASTHILTSNETFIDGCSCIGPSIPPNGISGFLSEPAEDPMGCSVVEAPGSSWIALVKRGECTFLTKIRMMQKSGAVAVIVGDPKEKKLTKMCHDSDTSDVLIPSVSLAKYEYKRILHLTQLSKTPLETMLKNDKTKHKAKWNWSVFDMSFFNTLSFVISLIMIAYGPKGLTESKKQRMKPTPDSEVSKLAIKVFSEKEHINTSREKEQGQEGCVVCLEEKQQKSELRLVPCNHQFHTSCVDPEFIAQKKLCPICEKGIDIMLHRDLRWYQVI